MDNNKKDNQQHTGNEEELNRSQEQSTDQDNTKGGGLTSKTSDILTRRGDHGGSTRSTMGDKLGRTGSGTDGQVG